MKNNILLLTSIAVVCIVFFVLYSLNKNMSESNRLMKQDSFKNENAMMKKSEPDTMMDKSNDDSNTLMMKNNADSRYVQYSPEVLAANSGKKRVFFFYASWCPLCKSADTSFQGKMASIPADVVVIRVNYNDPDTDQSEKDLAKQYGITYQHTFVQIDATGNEVTKWNGGQITELLKNIK